MKETINRISQATITAFLNELNPQHIYLNVEELKDTIYELRRYRAIITTRFQSIKDGIHTSGKRITTTKNSQEYNKLRAQSLRVGNRLVGRLILAHNALRELLINLLLIKDTSWSLESAHELSLNEVIKYFKDELTSSEIDAVYEFNRYRNLYAHCNIGILIGESGNDTFTNTSISLIDMYFEIFKKLVNTHLSELIDEQYALVSMAREHHDIKIRCPLLKYAEGDKEYQFN
jgi:hypothetical protein